MKYAESILRLMHAESYGVTVELNTEILLNWAEVIGLKSAVKVVFELGDEMEVASSDKDIINIDKKSNGIIANVSKVKVRVRVGLRKLPSKKSGMKACIPSTRTLAQTIKRFVKLAHEMFSSFLDKT